MRADEQILHAVARLVAAYVESLEFENASPYDRFLEKNILPGEPREFERDTDYAVRLRQLVAMLEEPKFITPADGAFQLIDQPFQFGSLELEGLRIFLDRKRGNCVACHTPPRFTDFGFHNTGASQEEYDAMHGAGSFAALAIPDLTTRNADPDRYLPATAAHPQALEPFRAPASADAPGRTDLGVVEHLPQSGRPESPPAAQPAANGVRVDGTERRVQPVPGRARRRRNRPLQDARPARPSPSRTPICTPAPRTTLEDVVRFYVTESALARAGQLRNGARELRAMQIGEDDVAPLAAFLRALNEDYE